MRLPYNHVHASGDVLFAARGGRIYAFSLADGSHLTEWQHPGVRGKKDVEEEGDAIEAEEKEGDANEAEEKEEDAIEAVEETAKESRPADTDAEDRPAKRQRIESGEPSTDTTDPSTTATTDPSAATPANPPTKKSKKQKKKERDEAKPKRLAIASVPDRPVIIHLTSTTDGSRVLAVSGHDKTVWVFAHDGRGVLEELSRRTMPKRPSSVVICPDDATILVADKFGDVYSLPLVPSPDDMIAAPAPMTRPQPKFPAATALTVHSKANLRSLENQLRDLESPSKSKSKPKKLDNPPPAPFKHTLELGHVSMLTALALAHDYKNRRYIITADRDEHVRVSRFMPQAYVIESYCLAHLHFVSALAVIRLPPSRVQGDAPPEILVSAGGDPNLFVWDFLPGRLVSRADVLGLAREVTANPDLENIAVVALVAATVDEEAHLFAILEGIPHLFHWTLDSTTTLIPQPTHPLSANPLHITTTPTRLIIALDTTSSPSANSLATFRISPFAAEEYILADVLEESEVTHEEVRGLFYNTASLRKMATGAEGEVEGEGEGDIEVDGAAEGA